MATSKTVFVQNWEESERGYGTRPDGFTVHISKDQHETYVHWFYSNFNNLPQAPSEYTRCAGDPIEVEVDTELFGRIERAAARPREDGNPLNAVHGSSTFFEISPPRALKDSDIAWPKGDN